MKPTDWNNGMNHVDPDLVEEFVRMGERLEAGKQPKTVGAVWMRVGVIAACLGMVVLTAFALLPLHMQDPPVIPLPETDAGDPSTDTDTQVTPGDSTSTETNQPDTPDDPPTSDTLKPDDPPPVVNREQTPSAAPFYYGSESSIGGGNGTSGELNTSGLSITAHYVEALPDTYVFFDDWRQTEFRLLRLETVSLLKGEAMTDEFYYIVPVEFMTDFSIFHILLLKDMAQYGYEGAVLYNKTQGCAERLDLVLFGYVNGSTYQMGEKVMAFDQNGILDARLWESNQAWIDATEGSLAYYGRDYTMEQAKEKISQSGYSFSVVSIKDITGEAAAVLSNLQSFENGLFVPVGDGWLLYSASLNHTRYINGLPTNEYIRIHGSETFNRSHAQFTQDDMNRLPDLPSAIATVKEAFEAGEITPPHLQNYETLELSTWKPSIFAWYAKTDNGVIGVVRVNWRYEHNIDDWYWEDNPEDWYYWREFFDDAYYIIEYGSDDVTPIDRDALLERIGSCESSYVYGGEYDENGKILPMMPVC